MIFELGSWRFFIDVEATKERTAGYSYEHCQCLYCKNFYDAVDSAYPLLRPAMENLGVYLEGPCELMPFEPTLMLACYRLDGQILQWGNGPLYAGGVTVVPEYGDEETFLLWVGEMALPWLQEEAEEEVVSPANLPEFLDRMQTIWDLRHRESIIPS